MTWRKQKKNSQKKNTSKRHQFSHYVYSELKAETEQQLKEFEGFLQRVAAQEGEAKAAKEAQDVSTYHVMTQITLEN